MKPLLETLLERTFPQNEKLTECHSVREHLTLEPFCQPLLDSAYYLFLETIPSKSVNFLQMSQSPSLGERETYGEQRQRDRFWARDVAPFVPAEGSAGSGTHRSGW